MLIEYLSFYLIFVIVASILVSFVVLRFKFPAPQIVIPVVMSIIILPAVFVYLYITYFTSLPEVYVPDLKGMPLEEAFIKLEALKLKSRHAGSVYDMKYPEGRVVSQRPESSRKVKVGRTVYLLTSSGKRMVLVPNLLGRPLGQAKAVLSAKGLFLGQVTEDVVAELESGMILTQLPLPGEEVEAGSYINISISGSPESGMEVVEEEVAGEKKDESPRKDSEQGGFWPWW
ncbi:MAG: PASTA domain-containing protein [Candidatus Margulisbacteria bacterium]|nr:PASTA domain-containing protein [Candidatus Margulisiibacteriota bacterium]